MVERQAELIIKSAWDNIFNYTNIILSPRQREF